MHAGGDDTDDHGGEGGETVDVQGEVDGDGTGGGELGGGVDGPAAALAHGDHDGQCEGGERGQDGERADEARGHSAQEQSGDRAEERKEGTRTARVVVVTRWPRSS